MIERFSSIWKRLSFIQKVSLRNMLRYKRRLVMMLIGIGCCTALMLTAFGVRDSMINIGTLQYEKVQKYDAEVAFDNEKIETIKGQFDKFSAKYTVVYLERVGVINDKTIKSVKFISFENNNCNELWSFYTGDNMIAMPSDNEAIIRTKITEKLNVNIGDVIEIRNAELQTFYVTVCGY